MNATYMTQEILARASYPLEAQALRELYNLGKAQATVMPSVSSPAIGYQSRMHLLPSMDRVGYGRSGPNTGLQSRLSDDVLGLRRTNGIGYGSNFGYLVPQREIEKANQYMQ